MKKILTGVLVIMAAVFVVSCSAQQQGGATFEAMVKSLGDSSLLVTTSDKSVGFDQASVSVTKDTVLVDANGKAITLSDISVGSGVTVTIGPEVAESYPVQATALKIVFKGKAAQTFAPDVSQSTAAGGLESMTPFEPAEYRKITPEQAKERIDAGGVILLDVRTQEEYDAGHIEGSTLIPLAELKDRAESELPDKAAEILVYCRSGNRSKTASEELLQMGYVNVSDMGGINDWPYEIVK